MIASLSKRGGRRYGTFLNTGTASSFSLRNGGSNATVPSPWRLVTAIDLSDGQLRLLLINKDQLV